MLVTFFRCFFTNTIIEALCEKEKRLNNYKTLSMKYFSVLFLLLWGAVLSAQTETAMHLELVFDRTGIVNSIHLLASHHRPNFYISYGLRYHLNEQPTWNEGQAFKHTMYAKNVYQHFGPVFTVNFYIPVQRWSAQPFVGYYTQLGIMMRRVVLSRDFSRGTWTTFEEDSPLYRWENQLIVGSYFPITNFWALKLYGGIGVSGIYNISYLSSSLEGEKTKGKTYELGSQFGIGISYDFESRQ